MDFRRYFMELNKIEGVFPDKSSVNINEVGQYINQRLGMMVEHETLRKYLKEKGYKKIVEERVIPEVDKDTEAEKELEVQPETDIDLDLEMDDILEMNIAPNTMDGNIRDEFVNRFNSQQPGAISKLTYGDNTELVRAYQKTKDIKVLSSILELNNKLIVKEALYYTRRLSGHGVGEDDLIQEGRMGLIKAVTMFDCGMGYEFSTYAKTWIKQHIVRYIYNNENTIRIPVHRIEQIKKMNQCEKRHLVNGGKIEFKKICEEMGITEEMYYKLKYYDYCFNRIDSLDKPVGEEEDTRLIDMVIQDYEQEPVIDDVLRTDLKKEIKLMLNALPQRERDIIDLRYGFSTGRPLTLEKVGQKYNVTRERIRQIEIRALKRLRNSSNAKYLADYSSLSN